MINNQFIDCLKLIDGITIHTGDAIGADYCHDEYPGGNFAPEAVVEAKSAEEVAAVLKLCSENDVPVTVRGAGTGQVGGSVPVKGGVVLSVKGMDKILGYNEEERTLRVQPGVLLQDVKAEAEKHGLYYPPDPGEKTATIGGNAATDAGGPCAVKYGSTKDYILDAVIVLADGSITTLAGNEAVIGSEGTLAVICELTLKLVDKPKADAILLLPFMDTESCIKAAATVIGTGCAPAVVEYMDTDMVEFSGNVTGNPRVPGRNGRRASRSDPHGSARGRGRRPRHGADGSHSRACGRNGMPGYPRRGHNDDEARYVGSSRCIPHIDGKRCKEFV